MRGRKVLLVETMKKNMEDACCPNDLILALGVSIHNIIHHANVAVCGNGGVDQVALKSHVVGITNIAFHPPRDQEKWEATWMCPTLNRMLADDPVPDR